MTNLVELLAANIIEKVEPLTRYDRSSLNLKSGETHLAFGRVASRYSVDFSTSGESGAGRLSYVEVRVEAFGQLESLVQETERNSRLALPQKFEEWVKAHGNSDRELTPSDCFAGPKTFGNEKVCQDCSGEGKLRCRRCPDNLGKVKCHICSDGTITCDRCKTFIPSLGQMVGAKSKISCPSCKGAGQIGGGNRCGSCKGSGKVICTKCAGSRRVGCRNCGGSGWIKCEYCSGTGYLRCRPCEGTGCFYTLRKLECTVSNFFGVSVDSKEEVEVEKVLASCDLRRLGVFATVVQKPVTVGVNSIERKYSFECPVTDVSVCVASEEFPIFGYGICATVVNFKRIVAHILSNDLISLREAVEKTPWRLWGNHPGLVKATKNFIDSEVNTAIYDESQRGALVADSTIDQGYIDDAQRQLRSALGRLYFASLGPAFIAIGILPAFTLAIIQVSNLWEIVGIWAIAIAAGVGLFSLWVIERRAVSQLTTLLNGQSKESEPARSIKALLGKNHILWFFRALAILLAVLVSSPVVAYLLPSTS